MSDIIQTLWIGDRLSKMELVCLNSYLKNDHEVHLYTYSEIENVPSGVIVKDGREILPEDMIFIYKDHKSYSGFSNYFRYKLLYDKGGYWTDTDIVCLKKFDFNSPYVFCSEEILPLGQGNTHVGSCLIKMPVKSPVAHDAYQICLSKKPEELKWGEIGPRLVKEMVEKYNLNQLVKEPKVFCPVPGCEWIKYIQPNAYEYSEETYAIHLWNEMWRRSNIDKNSKFDTNSFYEKAYARYCDEN